MSPINQDVTEAELATKANGPRVTADQINDIILSEHYFTAADGVDGEVLGRLRARNAYVSTRLRPLKDDPPIDGTPLGDLQLLTFCVLRLTNGFTVHGTSACADPANYDADIGRRIARSAAIREIWPLLGYELKTLLSQGADQSRGASEPQASASSPNGAEEATVRG